MTAVHRFFPLFDSYIYELCSTLDAVKYSTLQVLRDFKNDGVCYLELRTTPRERASESITKALYVTTVLDSIDQFLQNENDGAMSVSLILSIDRRNTPVQALDTVDLAIKYRERGVVGIDLCGNPTKGDVASFREAMAVARSAGLKITLHFAEVPESSTRIELEILLSYHPDRLGHVINVPSDICRQIAEAGIGLELCLSCNVHAKLVPGGGGFADHHFGYWRDKGCPITLCVSCIRFVHGPLEQFSLTPGSALFADGRCRRLSQSSFQRISHRSAVLPAQPCGSCQSRRESR
jgi:adenosine deaminase